MIFGDQIGDIGRGFIFFSVVPISDDLGGARLWTFLDRTKASEVAVWLSSG